MSRSFWDLQREEPTLVFQIVLALLQLENYIQSIIISELKFPILTAFTESA